MTVGAFVGCVYQVATIFVQYYLYEVSVSQTLTFQRQTTFPAVTICNMNPVRRSAVSSNPQLSQVTSKQSTRRRRSGESRSDVVERTYDSSSLKHEMYGLKQDVNVLKRDVNVVKHDADTQQQGPQGPVLHRQKRT